MSIDFARPREALLGSTTPRIYTRPLVTGRRGRCGCGCALSGRTSAGFAAVKFAEERLGFILKPWQRWFLIHALELRPDGRYRYRTVLLLVGRRNGKTTVIEVKDLHKMFAHPRHQVIGTAQDLDISEETLADAIGVLEDDEELSDEIAYVNKTNGKKALVLRNGSRWKVKAASRRGGRGLDGDDVDLDELREHQTWDAWAAVTKTTLAKDNPQVWALSNAGDRLSVVLNALTAKGRKLADEPIPSDPTFGHFEWSAPDHIKCTCLRREDGDPHDVDCRLQDRRAWAMANPSLGYGITEEALASALDTDPTAVFRTECLCQRVDNMQDGILTAQWAKLADPESRRKGDLAFGVDIAPLRDYAAITVFGTRDDGLGYARLVDYQAGVAWLVPRLAELRDALNPLAVGMGRATYSSLAQDLASVGLTVPTDPDEPARGDLAVLTAVDMSAACGQIVDAVREETFRYIPATQLDESVAGAKPRRSGDGIAWARTEAGTDTAPLVSLTVARWAYLTRLGVASATAYDPLANIW